MRWLEIILPPGSVAGGLATLSVAIVLGLALGAIRIRGISLGVAAVFFSAVMLSAMGLTVSPDVLQFLRDFSLIVFIYTIGLQVGPSFFSSLRAEGVKLNLLSVLTILLGALMSIGIVWILKLQGASAAGIFTGGFATTPGLGAAQEALRGTVQGDSAELANKTLSLAYAVTYPFGLVGPILLILVLRTIFKVDVADERRQLTERDASRRLMIGHVDIEVTRPEMVGRALKDLNCVRERGIIMSRLFRNKAVLVPTAATRIELGDHYRAVGPLPILKDVVVEFGRPSTVDLANVSAELQLLRLIVTRPNALGKTLLELNLTNRFGVNLVRINRAGVELEPRAKLRLAFGDIVSAVGPKVGIQALEQELGNSQEALDTTQLIPIFLGFVLGVLAGSIPLALPGINSGLRLGLAGGPMLVAILLSRLGNVGPLVWYMPAAAQTLFRDFGMAVFLACVGLSAGGDLAGIWHNPSGLMVILWGAVITMVPMFIVAVIARAVLKMNFITLCGLIAGAMTSSPTLLFANDLGKSREPAVAYAAVYPLATLLPVFFAQLLITMLR